jgi:hypothetical protein
MITGALPFYDPVKAKNYENIMTANLNVPPWMSPSKGAPGALVCPRYTCVAQCARTLSAGA